MKKQSTESRRRGRLVEKPMTPPTPLFSTGSIPRRRSDWQGTSSRFKGVGDENAVELDPGYTDDPTDRIGRLHVAGRHRPAASFPGTWVRIPTYLTAIERRRSA